MSEKIASVVFSESKNHQEDFEEDENILLINYYFQEGNGISNTKIKNDA